MMNYQITDHEKFMMEKMGDYLAHYVEASSPVTLDFQPKTLYFESDDTENYGILKVARNVAEDNSRRLRLQLGALRKAKTVYPEDADILFVLKYHMVSVVDSTDATTQVFEKENECRPAVDQ